MRTLLFVTTLMFLGFGFAPALQAQTTADGIQTDAAQRPAPRVLRGGARLTWLRTLAKPSNDVRTTKVLPGDSLWSIAVRFYGSAERMDWLRAANPGIENKMLRTGMVLRVPVADKIAPPERWAEKTWQALQQKFGDDWVFVRRPLEGAPPDVVAKVTRGYAIAPDDEPTLATIHVAPTWAVKIRPPEPNEP